MATFNRVFILGNIVRDPELQQTNSGHFVTNFCVAVNPTSEKYGNVLFQECKAWRNTAQFICQWFKKGTKVFIEGELEGVEFAGKDGVKRTKTIVRVINAQFAESAPKGRAGLNSYEEQFAPGDKLPPDLPSPQFEEADTEDLPL